MTMSETLNYTWVINYNNIKLGLKIIPNNFHVTFSSQVNKDKIDENISFLSGVMCKFCLIHFKFLTSRTCLGMTDYFDLTVIYQPPWRWKLSFNGLVSLNLWNYEAQIQKFSFENLENLPVSWTVNIMIAR